MKARLISREVLPFVGPVAAGAGRGHPAVRRGPAPARPVWIGRWLGIPGTLLILGSLAYSLRKRKLIRQASPAKLLRWHEALAWAGFAAGAGACRHPLQRHPGLAGHRGGDAHQRGSGLTGKFLLDRSRRRMDEARQRMRDRRASAAEQQAERSYWDSLTFDAVKQWRVGALSRSRWLSRCWRWRTSWPTFLFWGWK
jgi:hypothetical protein